MKIGRNDPCPCGSGLKYKKCHWKTDSAISASVASEPKVTKSKPQNSAKMQTMEIPQDVKEQYRYAIMKVREDRDRYFKWIKDEIEKAIELINQFDKIYVLGALGARLIQASPTLYTQFLEDYTGHDKAEMEKDMLKPDDQVEVMLEYAMSIATATPNVNQGKIPSRPDVDAIYEQLAKIKQNVAFWEMSADVPKDGTEFDHWLRTSIVLDTIHVRGDGYQSHIQEVYHEMFAPFNDFLIKHYGFSADDLFSVIAKLDSLVYSKIGNPIGAKHSHNRLTEWMDKTGQDEIMKTMTETGKHFIQQFVEANPDLYDAEAPEQVIMHEITRVESYKKIFWVIPQSDIERLIFENLSLEFGANGVFFQPEKFKAFPLNDTTINVKPLVKENGMYFHFSMTLAYRNIFTIAEQLIKSADKNYYDNSFKGNSNRNSRDNYIENKTRATFEKILPSTQFYSSLEYTVIEDGVTKRTELDILGVSADAIYIIEVKAGELNQKHRRGALKGLKSRLEETINEGSYQCHRALKYIQGEASAEFEYVENGQRKKLIIDRSKVKNYFKISVMFEHFSSIAANLKYLVSSGILSTDYKWAWIVSLYDLMVFADLIESETDFTEYLTERIALYDRDDVEFQDELDILGLFMNNGLPVPVGKENEILQVISYKDAIEDYYNKLGIGVPHIIKPMRKEH
ncbi:MAG: SEC-C domain-containing protein [Bacteroidia bacterium]